VAAGVEDQFLVEAAQAGDLDAFATLVRRHQAAVYRIALRLLGSSADADDVTQDTFLRAWRALARFRGDSTVATWLYRIVTRRCFDVLATRRPTEPLEEKHLEIGVDPAATIEQRERLRAVARQIQALPDDQRAALVLREFEGLTYEQLADVLDTTVPAIKGRIHRARLAVLKETTPWH
jgi:RNA polymerase sigma-70 factor (ECF subfamily)